MAAKKNPIPLTQAMVNVAIYNLSLKSTKKKAGSVSGAKIKQFISKFFGKKCRMSLNYWIRKYLDQGIQEGILIQVSGKGMRGSYQMTATARMAFEKKLKPYQEMPDYSAKASSEKEDNEK